MQPKDKNSALEEVLDQYLQEMADGLDPDQESYLNEYPELAKALRGVFKTLDFVESASRGLNASRLEKGQDLGDYRIIREIGRGGMGVVYEAVQKSLNRYVALKVLAIGAISDNALERFYREAEAAGKLHHSNIVPVYAVGEEQGIHFYIMQYIKGESLSEKIQDLKRASIKCDRRHFINTALLGAQAADGLYHAHNEGIIHRDIKPSNLLVDKADNLWITDFGLAKTGSQATITISGDVVGTARYMSPEQARGDRSIINAKTDIYSLGITLYELSVLTPAFDSESRDGMLNKIILTEPTPLRKVNSDVPRDLETIISKCIEKDPDQRYEDAGEVTADLKRFYEGEPILARRISFATKTGRFIKRYRVRLAGLLMLLVLIATAFTLMRKIRLDEGARRLEEAFSMMMIERKPDEANKLLDRAEQCGIDSVKLYLYRGLIPLMNSQPQEAIEKLQKALDRDPNHTETLYALSFAYQDSAKMSEASVYFKMAEKNEIRSSLGWFLRGYALSHNASKEAIECYNKTIALRPDFIPALEIRANYRTSVLLTEGDREQLDPMLKDYDAWVRFQPDSAKSYTSRGRGWLCAAAYANTQKDIDRSSKVWLGNCKADLQKAISLSSKSGVLAHSINGLYLRYIGDFKGSARAYDQSNEAYKHVNHIDHPALLHNQALALYAMGMLEESMAKVEQSCKIWSNNEFPFPLQKAMLLAELDRVEEGREALRTCLKPQEENAVRLFTSVAGLEFLGDHEGAINAARVFADYTDKGKSLANTGQESLAPILLYLLGEMDADSLIQAAEGIPRLLCIYSFQIALCELGRGHREAGLVNLKQSLDTGVITYLQYRFAQALNARADADPNWPAWIPIEDE